jgi:hypothetical protein
MAQRLNAFHWQIGGEMRLERPLRNLYKGQNAVAAYLQQKRDALFDVGARLPMQGVVVA